MVARAVDLAYLVLSRLTELAEPRDDHIRKPVRVAPSTRSADDDPARVLFFAVAREEKSEGLPADAALTDAAPFLWCRCMIMRTRSEARLSLLAMAGVVTLVLRLPAPVVALATPCEKAVVLEGPRSLRQPIARRLEASGIAVNATGTCDAVRVQLSSSSPSEFDLHVEDRFGRTSHRTVSDTGTAVSLIESWAAGIDGNLPVDVDGAGTASSATNVLVEAPVAAAAVPGRLRLYGGIVRELGGYQAVEGGALAGACLRAGPVCLGVELYGAGDLGGGVASADVLLTATLPLETERWLLMPGIGVGPGWTRARLGADGMLGGAGGTVDSVGILGAIALIVGARLSQRVAVGLDVGGVVGSGARSGWPRTAWGQPSSYPDHQLGVSGRAGLVCVVTP